MASLHNFWLFYEETSCRILTDLRPIYDCVASTASTIEKEGAVAVLLAPSAGDGVAMMEAEVAADGEGKCGSSGGGQRNEGGHCYCCWFVRFVE
jgi:hypothetical protein